MYNTTNMVLIFINIIISLKLIELTPDKGGSRAVGKTPSLNDKNKNLGNPHFLRTFNQ